MTKLTLIKFNLMDTIDYENFPFVERLDPIFIGRIDEVRVKYANESPMKVVGNIIISGSSIYLKLEGENGYYKANYESFQNACAWAFKLNNASSDIEFFLNSGFIWIPKKKGLKKMKKPAGDRTMEAKLICTDKTMKMRTKSVTAIKIWHNGYHYEITTCRNGKMLQMVADHVDDKSILPELIVHPVDSDSIYFRAEEW